MFPDAPTIVLAELRAIRRLIPHIAVKPFNLALDQPANSNSSPLRRAQFHCTRPFCCGSPFVGWFWNSSHFFAASSSCP